MQRFAPLINVAIFLLSGWTGYGALDAGRLRGTNPDQYFAIASFVTGIIFPLLAIPIFGGGQATLRAPSWTRVAFNWSRDPLQLLFVSTYSVGAMALGAALHLRGTSTTGFWMFMFFVSLFTGFAVGQFIMYRVYRRRITKA